MTPRSNATLTRAAVSWSSPSRGSMVASGVALALVIEAASLVGGGPTSRLAERLPWVDKVLHAVAFLGLFVACHAIGQRWLKNRLSAVTLGFALSLLAVGDELAQGFQVERHVDPLDSLAGIVLGVAWVSRGAWRARAAAAGAVGLVVAASVTTDSYFEARHMVTALRHERVGDFVGSRREYRLPLAEGVRSPALFNELAWVEIESGIGDAAEAVAFAGQALVLAPDDSDIHETYGWALHHAGRSADALPFLARAFRTKPDMFCIHFHLGEVYLALGQTEQAMAHLRTQVDRPDTVSGPSEARPGAAGTPRVIGYRAVLTPRDVLAATEKKLRMLERSLTFGSSSEAGL